MKKIDITMTATIRPDILQATLKSFFKGLFSENIDKFRLIINIDLIGDERYIPEDVLNICKSYFKNDKLIYNISKNPSFPKAVKWVWENSDADYIFHLEDDWLLNKKIDINHMIDILDKYSNLACLRLPKHNISSNKKVMKMFDCIYEYNSDGFYIAEQRGTQFGLNPNLIKKEFIKKALPLMVDDKNPEKQFRFKNKNLRNLIMLWDYGIYGIPGEKAIVSDNGRNWISNTCFSKPVSGDFLSWIKK